MKKDIHPDYREVVFTDASADFQFITRSTVQAKDTIELNGKTYPHILVDISSESHPFFTGKMKFVDTAGRVEKFQNKFDKTMKKQKKEKAAAVEQAKLDKIAAEEQREADKVARAEAKAKADEKKAKEKASIERKKKKEEDKIAAAKEAMDAKNAESVEKSEGDNVAEVATEEASAVKEETIGSESPEGHEAATDVETPAAESEKKDS
jgi:large subunit ribosomal protein L31